MKRKAQIIFITLVVTGLFLSRVNVVFAVTANPVPINYTQPDGSGLTVLLEGDEFIHWAVTSDGYTIMTNSGGTYEYAMRDESGRLVFSGIQANDPGKRKNQEISWLTKTGKNLFFSEAQVREMKGLLVTGGNSDAPLTGGFPSTGTRKLLMILANFSNTATTYTQASFNNYMNQLNYNGTGSFRDYYIEVSYGQLTVNTTVTTWVTLPNTHDYYGPDSKWGEFAYHAVVAAENQAMVNFAEYDNNLDGIVDGVAIIHQGQGQEESGNPLDIWSHSWDLSSAGYSAAQRTFDGVQVNSYTTMPERNATGMGTIGVMCHEFCHNLGSPDFYDTDYSTGGSYTGTGKWDLMAGGSWNGLSGTSPAHPNAWIKAFLGWTNPVTVGTIQNITLRNAQLYPDVVRYNTTTANEYFLCENRQQTGFDSGIPGHGMIIYHVDGNYISAHMTANNINAASHQGLYPVCANAIGNPVSTYGTINGTGCSFPGSAGKTSFTDVTTPNAHSWAGAVTDCPVSNIFEYSLTSEISFCFINCYTPDDPTAFTALPFSLNQINLSWGLNANSNPVLLAFSATPSFGNPVAGTNYAPGDLVPGGGTILSNGTNTSYFQTGLNPSTTYYYKAWSILTGVTYSPGVISRATTLCGSISSFPWNEGFENGGASPGCWTQEQVNNSGIYWTFITGNGAGNPTSAHNGLYNASLKDKTTADNKTRLITPVLNLGAVLNPQLSFWHTQPQWGTDQDRLSVYYRTSAGGTWTLLATYISNIAGWTQETINLPNASATYCIAFEGNVKFGFGICLDDIQVAGSCATYLPVGISIAPSMNPVCSGAYVTCTAAISNGGSSPAYQWKVGGTNVTGATNSTYTYTPGNGDLVTCTLTSNAACITGNPATSNLLAISENPSLLIGSITGNQTIGRGFEPQQLTGTPPLNGSAPTYQWQSSLDNTTFTNIMGATCLDYLPASISVTSYYRQTQNAAGTCGGPLPTNVIAISVINVPATNVVQNIAITGVQCFNAIQSVTVAGDGTLFTVESGGQATMIAGQSISYLPGTKVLPGGYMHGYITSTGTYCLNPVPLIAAAVDSAAANTTSLATSFTKVYPNPNNGLFCLELNGHDASETTRVDIYNMTGETVFSILMTGESKHYLSLTGQPAGIYLLQCTSGEKRGTSRIIKQ